MSIRHADSDLNVLMLSDVYFPRINGVSTSIETFRRELAAHNIKVTVAAPAYPAPDASGSKLKLDESCDDIWRVPSRQVPLDPEDRLMTRAGLSALRRRVASADFSLIHIQTPFAAHYAGLKLAKHLNLPVIATYHTHFEEYLFHYIPLFPKNALRGLSRKFARGQCNALDAVVVPSRPMAETLSGYGVETTMHVIPTGLPDSQFMRGDGMAFRKAYGIGPERKIALFVGRAAFEKNIDFLLEVTNLARRHRPDLLLVIAGEGPALEPLRRKAAQMGIADHVLFVGYLQRESGLRDCYAAADIFTFASKTETQGLVLLEAMAVGLPVLAIPALGAGEIIAPQRGAVAAADNAETFASQLVGLLDDPARLTAMASEAIGFAREWDAGTQAERLANLYREIIRQPATVTFCQPPLHA